MAVWAMANRDPEALRGPDNGLIGSRISTSAFGLGYTAVPDRTSRERCSKAMRPAVLAAAGLPVRSRGTVHYDSIGVIGACGTCLRRSRALGGPAWTGTDWAAARVYVSRGGPAGHPSLVTAQIPSLPPAQSLLGRVPCRERCRRASHRLRKTIGHGASAYRTVMARGRPTETDVPGREPLVRNPDHSPRTGCGEAQLGAAGAQALCTGGEMGFSIAG